MLFLCGTKKVLIILSIKKLFANTRIYHSTNSNAYSVSINLGDKITDSHSLLRKANNVIYNFVLGN